MGWRFHPESPAGDSTGKPVEPAGGRMALGHVAARRLLSEVFVREKRERSRQHRSAGYLDAGRVARGGAMASPSILTIYTVWPGRAHKRFRHAGRFARSTSSRLARSMEMGRAGCFPALANSGMDRVRYISTFADHKGDGGLERMAGKRVQGP